MLSATKKPTPREQAEAARKLLATKGLVWRSFAKTYSTAVGNQSSLGGWIYTPDGRVICQGFAVYFNNYLPADYREFAEGSMSKRVLSFRGREFFESMLANRLKGAVDEIESEIEVISGADRQEKAREMMLNALKAIVLDDKRRANLELEDPSLLFQIYDAIRMADPVFERAGPMTPNPAEHVNKGATMTATMQHNGCRRGRLQVGDRVVSGGVTGRPGAMGGTVVKVTRLNRKDGDSVTVEWDNGYTRRTRSCALEYESHRK